MSSSGEKTEKPTQKRLRDSRKKGQVAKSQDLSSAVMLIFVFSVGWILSSYIGGLFQESFKRYIQFATSNKKTFTSELALSFVREGFGDFLLIMLPIFVVTVIVGFSINYLQIGSLLSFEAIKPDLKKIDPIQAFQQKFFKPRPYIELVKTILKIIIIGYIIWTALWNARNDIINLTNAETVNATTFLLNLIFSIGIKVGFAFLVIGAGDFFLQKYLHQKELMMTKQELKEEYKESEGNPQMKGQRRFLHQQLSMQPMAKAVQSATVVVTNPTHLAVALSYRRGNDEAPTIVAKGADLMAAQIRKIAAEADIPITRNISLARALYEIEIEEEVPEELYEAVAVVLRWVYESSNVKK